MSSAVAFVGSIPEHYDGCLGGILFEPYAADMAERLTGKHNKILELACGTGRLTRHLVNSLAPEGTLIATDLNREMMEVATAKVHDRRVRWQLADAQELPFADDQFDLVVCQFGVMFFPDKQRAFEEARRVLVSGGTFLFNTWDSMRLNRHALIMAEVLKEVFGPDAPDFDERGPYSYYDTTAILKTMKRIGFHSIRIDAVQLQGSYRSAEEVMKGFTDGSPLAIYLAGKEPAKVEQVKQMIRSRIDEAFGKKAGDVALHAFVCKAEK